MENRPLLLRPTGKDYLWGGRRLNDEFAKNIPMSPLAETWECSTHPAGKCFVAEGEFAGAALADVLAARPDFLGTRHAAGGELPLLVKFIDADKDLSVQVHPDDDYAETHENGQRGKTELWYVLDAAPDAKLIYGFRQATSRREVQAALSSGKLAKLLQQIKVKKGDLFFIRPGTVHAVGAGTLIAEIQESSDLTYRLYDYDRIDKNGKKRPLHVDKALDVTDFRASPPPRQPMRVLKYRCGIASELLCRCRYFEACRMILNTERRQEVFFRTDETSFRVLLCVSGCGAVKFEGGEITFYKGDCIFVPAASTNLRLHGFAQFLDVRC